MLVFCFTILFFAPLSPILTVIGIIGSILLLASFKVIWLKRNVVKHQIDYKLVLYTSRILKIGVFAFGLSNMIFFAILLETFSVPSILTFIQSTLFLLLPIRSFLIEKYVTPFNRNDGVEYREVSHKFKHYDLSNPITVMKAIKRLRMAKERGNGQARDHYENMSESILEENSFYRSGEDESKHGDEENSGKTKKQNRLENLL
jgi:hypothetical protein